MLRYLPGILVVQLVTVAIFWANQDRSVNDLLVSAVLPAALIALVTAFWFASISRADGERLLGKIRHQHAKEREKLQIDAEKDKAKVLKETHKTIRREERRVGRKANLKVGLAFMGAAMAGVVMIITELLTLGLITITTAGGAMGGYLLRWRQASQPVNNELADNQYEVVSVQDSNEESNTRPSPSTSKQLPEKL
ncbi:MAG: hypothetical protein KTR35_09170 [Gammaproteobacteria bacterium]|nr:hypothetical protein [Gammaproteobacteria bacterium]